MSPEVAEADSKKKEESLKNATFDMDEDLFDDAGKGLWRAGWPKERSL